MGRENAGMSSVLHVEIMHTVSLRVPKQGLSASGQSGLRRSRRAKPMDNRFIFLYHSSSFTFGCEVIGGTQGARF